MVVGERNVDRERKNEIGRAFYWRHHEQSLERGRKQRMVPGYIAYARGNLLTKKIAVLSHYGNGVPSCVSCGYTNIKALSIDHINGRTPTEPQGRKLNGIGIYGWLVRGGYPEGYQTLCMNCQFIKREDNREFRNQYTGGKKRK